MNWAALNPQFVIGMPAGADVATMKTLTHRYVLERRRRGELGPHTWRVHDSVLRRFAVTVGTKPPRKLSRRDIDRYLETVGHLAPATRRNRVSIVRGFCRWLADNGHVSSDPMHGLRPPRPPRSVPRALSREQVTAALGAAGDQRSRLVIVLMVQQGLRRAEVAGLQVGDLDIAHRQMRVVGKGGHERFVWITDETVRELKLYLDEHPASDGPLIRSYLCPHCPVGATYIGRIVARALYAAGVKHAPRDGISGHALRHTAATDMLRHGAHVRDVQAVLGHAHLVTTERYLPRLVGTLEQAMEGRTYNP